MKLTDFQALTFDCYGTLIDWETGLARELVPWARKARITAGDDELLEAFAGIENDVEAKHPSMRYPDVLAATHSELAQRFGVRPDEAGAAEFGRSIGRWPSFADSPEALQYLKRHYKLVILSNVDRASFAQSNKKLGVVFDSVVTAEDVGSYKPDARNFRAVIAAVEKLGVPKDKILHTAQSLFHDIVPGRALGLATCWINRRAGKAGAGATKRAGAEARPDFTFTSMGALASEHRRETGD